MTDSQKILVAISVVVVATVSHVLFRVFLTPLYDVPGIKINGVQSYMERRSLEQELEEAAKEEQWMLEPFGFEDPRHGSAAH